MAEQEKRAWFILGVIVLTLAVYIAFVSLVRFDSVSLAVFALAGFLGLRTSKQRRGAITYDERDRQIEKQALVSSMCIFYVLIILLSLAAGFTQGWDTSVRLWVVIQIFWAVSLAIWGVKALIVIMLYRRGSHA
jgi:uncharacterized membrane protein (DUF485 family)